ncbi:hypothetical protein KAFR_0E02250 [Kazachstania africana CBS 2517]|uniref:Uncharacterized protein n=1 Tax=Kazachstania africana (strain ATCC 22294 / BCRC 22015 / CBS 2517 / CECT 1963 / NBRC 1671 / NRRL Y-8276) TaxID=1071382 RepID=H2AVH8_KAZAF|nr:hypothetical protein KAFR_0E02250 [Kazachstania africana CBS 2517]CCF58378.1 hypothetical protein KAFR_0E02250 [Kazachstania africana CBS 2517]
MMEESTYFDTLCELEQCLQANYENLDAVLDTLQNLTSENLNDEQMVHSLQMLSKQYKALLDSSVDLRYSKFNTRESQIASIRNSERENNVFADTKPQRNLNEYVKYIENINRDTHEYVNLLERLSVDLGKQVDISDSNVTELVVDDWTPPSELISLLEQYNESSSDIELQDSKVDRYLDQLKLLRAKYAMENNYLLKSTLNDLNDEVNYWRREYENIESMMFGNGPNSMKKMLHNVEVLKVKAADPAMAENEEQPPRKQDAK